MMITPSETTPRRNSSVVRCLCTFLVFMSYLALNHRGYSRIVTNDTRTLLAGLEQAVNAGDPNEVRAIVQALQDCGPEVVSVIEVALKSSSGPLRISLVEVLTGIGDDQSTNRLLELALSDSDLMVAKKALAGLENRKINRRVSKDQIDIIAGRIEKGDVISAGLYARLLANCVNVSVFDRAVPILRRFKSEITEPSQLEHIWGAYLSGKAFALNQFIIAISALGRPAIPLLDLVRQESTTAQQAELKMWVTIAMGTAGAREVVEELRQLVEGENDPSVRALALRAYARSAKENAIPLLRSFIEDKDKKAMGYADCHGQVDPLQIVAKDEIARLENAKQAATTR